MSTRSISIRWLIAGASALLVLIVAAALTLYFASTQESQASAALSRKALTVSELVANNVKTAIEFDDAVMTEAIFQGARKDLDLAYLIARDADGEIVQAFEGSRAPPLQLPITVDQATLRAGDEAVHVMVPILLENGKRAALQAGFSTDRLRAEQARTAKRASGVALLCVLIGIVAAYLLGSWFAAPMGQLTEALEGMAAGELETKHTLTSRVAEIDVMAVAQRRVLSALREIVAKLRDGSQDVSGVGEQILQSSRESEKGANEQSASIEEIASSLGGVEESARVIAETGDQLARVAADMHKNMEVSRQAVTLAQGGMREIVQHQGAVSERIRELHERSRAVIAVVDMIDSISDRLDLLALNAALEGARAGEVGRGFALVASEMRRLAENVAASTREIKETIEEIQAATQLVQRTSTEGSDVVQRGAEEMERMHGAVSAVFGLLQEANGLAQRLGDLTQQQFATTRQTVAAMNEISSVATQTLRASQDLTQYAADLSSRSIAMRQLVQVFKLEG